MGSQRKVDSAPLKQDHGFKIGLSFRQYDGPTHVDAESSAPPDFVTDMAHILVVDDESLLLTLLANILEDEGYDVETASNGADALACARACSPSLIITDFMMPVMTGLDLARAIRIDAQMGNVPMMLVSGAQTEIGRCHPDLFQAVVDKPYESETLLTEVRRLLLNR
tara:strand:+ start:6536 stop:7036 length:501 start_codon:yes stop_codon:yes gene_type:complete